MLYLQDKSVHLMIFRVEHNLELWITVNSPRYYLKTAAPVVFVVEQARWGFRENLGEETHCDVLDGMGEWVGEASRDWIGRLGGGNSWP